MISTCAHTKTRSSASVAEPSPNRPESASDTGDQPAGHSFRPSAIRAACQSSSVVTIPAIIARIRSASPRWLPSKRAGPLHLADQHRADHAGQHQHREHVDQQREPALVAEPRQRGVAVDRADHRDHDRREEDEEAPEDRRVHQARDRAAGAACAGPARSRPRCGRAAGRSSKRSVGLPIRTRPTSSRARRANSTPPTASAAASASAPASTAMASAPSAARR